MFLNADRWDRNHRMAIAANVKLKWISSPTLSLVHFRLELMRYYPLTLTFNNDPP